MKKQKGKSHKKLSSQERDLIALWKGGGKSLREIARRLGRSHSTIVEEVKRNSYKEEYYIAINAQRRTDERKREARKRHPLKSKEIYVYVIEKLRRGWSPEQIAGRLRKKTGRTVICHETIYSFIYSKHPEAERMRLWEYLPRKQTKRKRQKGRKVKRERIPDRVSITKRPKSIAKRAQVGHWESDSMQGRKVDKNGVHVEVERVTRKVAARYLERVTADKTIQAQLDIFSALPAKARQTATSDNGPENVKHTKLRELDMMTYFTDGYSAWQKGSVENAIGLLRRYLPKGKSLNNLSQEELDAIVEEINSRPRKVLNYNTPDEVFDSLVNY